MLAGKTDPDCLVFVDEMGANISLSPLYAWSPKGERAHARVPRNRGKNTTLLASMGIEGIGHCLVVEGLHYHCGLRDLRRAGTCSQLTLRAARGDGQPCRSQGPEDQGTDRGTRMRARVPAALLSGPQPDRRSLLEDQAAFA